MLFYLQVTRLKDMLHLPFTFRMGWQDRAEEILQIVELDEIEQVSAMPQQFISPDASVVVLIGRDTAPVAVRSSGPEPIIRYRLGPEDVPINVPKDRFDARAFWRVTSCECA